MRDWLSYYARHFDTVELNNSFYRLPERAQFVTWGRQTPASFLFAVKASRFLTHLKRLREPEEPVRRLFQRARGLGAHLGPVLYQLPPTLTCDASRLEEFLAALPSHPQAIEFRHPSWYVPSIYRLLEKYAVTLCLHDKAGSAIVEPAIGPFLYVRFHGPSGHYHGRYSAAALDDWANRIVKSGGGRDSYVYFNNDVDAAAPHDAAAVRMRLTSARSRRRESPGGASRSPAGAAAD